MSLLIGIIKIYIKRCVPNDFSTNNELNQNYNKYYLKI